MDVWNGAGFDSVRMSTGSSNRCGTAAAFPSALAGHAGPLVNALVRSQRLTHWKTGSSTLEECFALDRI
jgi:hypothetical protein